MEMISVQTMMHILNELDLPDTSIALANDERFIYYRPSKEVDLHIRPGDQVSDRTVTHAALTKKERITAHKDSAEFGVPYYGMSMPIMDDDTIHGCVTLIRPSHQQFTEMASLAIRTVDRWKMIPFEDVVYIEAQSRKTIVHGRGTEGVHKLNITQLSTQLPASFMRCHRSYVVNVKQIAEIHPDSHSTFTLIMKNGVRVPVSQSYAKYFRAQLYF